MIGKKTVLDTFHEDVLKSIKGAKLPCTFGFTDRGQEYSCTFKQKPLGFSILKDENKRNAKVVRIKDPRARRAGVINDSFLIAVNHQNCWGIPHEQIVSIIRAAQFPVICRFRITPALKKL